MSVRVVSLVYIYCARWIPAHLRCTQCSILVCVSLSDLDSSRRRPLLWGAVPAIHRVRMNGLPKKRMKI